MITLSINVKKLDKLRFVEGEKGTYCDLILIETPNSEYGDYMVKQGMSKEQRDGGKETPILGNGKIVRKRERAPDSRPAPAQPDHDEIPF